MNKTYLKSLVELTVVTYLTSFVGLLAADGFDFFSLAAWKIAAGSGLPAAAAVVYGGFARLVGNYQSALAVDTSDTASSAEPKA
jgi:hypothetical protein